MKCFSIITSGRLIMRSAVIVGILFLFFALSRNAAAEDVQAPAAKGFENITMRSAWFPSGTISLKNGEYRGPAKPGSATEIVVKLTDQRAIGVVNGKDAAALVLVTDPGGSGMFYDLVLLFKRSGEWVYADTVRLGDRVKIHSVAITDNEILVTLTEHGPGDAMCCPSREVTRRFTVQADRLVPEHDSGPGSQDAAIIGPVWQWVRTNYNNDTILIRPEETTGYTLQLNSDGTVKVRGDCNAAGGSFTLKDNKLSISITHTTMAACPEGSLEGPFLLDLNRTNWFLMKNGKLFLDLKLDTGTMVFFRKEQNKSN